MNDVIRIRSSSLPSLFDCAMRWEAENIHGLRRPATAYTQIGTAVHKGTALYDTERMEKGEGNVSDAAECAVEAIERPDEEVEWLGMVSDRAIESAVIATTHYCDHIADNFTYRLVEYDLPPVQVDMGDGIIFELTGTLDRIYENDFGQRGVADVKTGQRIVNGHGDVETAKHLPQLGEYELLAEQEFGSLDAPSVIIGLQTSGAMRYGYEEIEGAKVALLGDEFNPGLLHYVANMFRTGLFPPNPSSFLCSNTYCPIYDKCQYHG